MVATVFSQKIKSNFFIISSTLLSNTSQKEMCAVRDSLCRSHIILLYHIMLLCDWIILWYDSYIKNHWLRSFLSDFWCQFLSCELFGDRLFLVCMYLVLITLTVLVTGESWNPLSAEQVNSPAMSRPTSNTSSFTLSPVLVNSAPVTASL